MKADEMRAIVAECAVPGYTFSVIWDSRGHLFLQGEYFEPDIHTGVEEIQKTRKWLLSHYMVKSEIVSTVFKCAMTSFEHRCREAFTYRGSRIFGPHFDVDALYEIAEKTTQRESLAQGEPV